jgi:hypothetical protein
LRLPALEQHLELVPRAALLERAGQLQVIELAVDLRVAHARKLK